MGNDARRTPGGVDVRLAYQQDRDLTAWLSKTKKGTRTT